MLVLTEPLFLWLIVVCVQNGHHGCSDDAAKCVSCSYEMEVLARQQWNLGNGCPQWLPQLSENLHFLGLAESLSGSQFAKLAG
jgi:hypothetical protein